jgi:hypothetical protein
MVEMKMTSSTTLKWIEVGKTLAADPKIKVVCPECGQKDLEVEDLRNELNPSE